MLHFDNGSHAGKDHGGHIKCVNPGQSRNPAVTKGSGANRNGHEQESDYRIPSLPEQEAVERNYRLLVVFETRAAG